MDIETSAKAMFDKLHARFNRMRDWGNHPDADSGAGELGRDSFREMAQAASDASADNPDAEALKEAAPVIAEEAEAEAHGEAPPLSASSFPANG
jgi:hypothetical protein